MTRKRRKINARRAENRRKTRARSAGVFCARFGSISTICARVRCVFCAFLEPTARFNAENDAQTAQNQRATRRKPAQNARAIGRRVLREIWRHQHGLRARSVRVLRVFGADGAFYAWLFDHVFCRVVSTRHVSRHDGRSTVSNRRVIVSGRAGRHIAKTRLRSEELFVFLIIFINVFINDTRRRKASFHRLVFRVV